MATSQASHRSLHAGHSSEDDREIVGFCHYGPSRDEDAEPHTGEVTCIYVLDDHWRRGGGTHLMRVALAAMAEAGYRKTTLWVLDGNQGAQRFYERLGWTNEGAVKVADRGSFELRYAQSL